MSATPNLEIWPENITAARIPANNNVRLLQAYVLSSAISATVTAQPTPTVDPDQPPPVYIIPPAATGAQWSGFDEGDVAIFYADTWTAFAPYEGLRKCVLDEGTDGENWQYLDGAWAPEAGGGGGGGVVDSIVAGTGISVDNTDPANPVVSATGTGTTITVDGVPGIDEIALGTNLSGSAAGSVFTLDATPGGGGGGSRFLQLVTNAGQMPQEDNVLRNTSSNSARGFFPRGRASGKRAFAARLTARGSNGSFSVGVMQQNSSDLQIGSTGSPGPTRTASWGIIVSGGQYVFFQGSTLTYGSISAAANDVLVFYFDLTTPGAGKIWCEINGTIPLSGDPVAGTNAAYSNLDSLLIPAGSAASSSLVDTEIEFDFSSTSPFGATIRSGYTMWDV